MSTRARLAAATAAAVLAAVLLALLTAVTPSQDPGPVQPQTAAGARQAAAGYIDAYAGGDLVALWRGLADVDRARYTAGEFARLAGGATGPPPMVRPRLVVEWARLLDATTAEVGGGEPSAPWVLVLVYEGGVWRWTLPTPGATTMGAGA